MFKCKVCNVSLFGIENYRIHMSGRKHKNAVAKAEGIQGTQGTPIPITVTTDDASLADVEDGAEFNCDVCNTKVFGKANYKTHIEGRKHLNKVKDVAAAAAGADGGSASGHPTDAHSPATVVPGAGGDTYTCDFCETVIYGKANYDLHVQGKKHINRVKASTGEEPGAADPGTKPTVTISDADDGAEFNCDVCNTKVFGKANYKIHIEGRKHLNKVKEAANGGGAATGQPTDAVVPGGETYNCAVCDTVIFGAENYTIHVQGKKHLFKAASMKTEVQFMASAITSKVVGSPAARVKLIHPDEEDSDDDEDGSTWRSFSSNEKGNLFAITVEESYEGGIGHFPWFPTVPNSQHALYAPSYVVVDGVPQPKAACCKVVCSVHHTIPLLPHESLKLTDVELCGRWFDVLYGSSSSIGARYRQAAAESSSSSSSSSTAEAPGTRTPSDDDICVDWANFLFCELNVGGDDSAPKLQFHPRWRLTVQAVSQKGKSLVPPVTELHQSGNLQDILTARQLEEKAKNEGSNTIRFPASSPLTLSGNSEGDSVNIEITLHLLMSTTEAMYQGETWMEQFRLSNPNAALEGPVCRLYGIPC